MSRTILDSDLRRWEVFASTDAQGFPRPGRLVFRCGSDPGQRSRAVEIDGSCTDAEALVHSRSDADLRDYLGRAAPLD